MKLLFATLILFISSPVLAWPHIPSDSIDRIIATHRVSFGQHFKDEWGNFTTEEVNLLTPLLESALSQFPKSEKFKKKNWALTIHVVKGKTYEARREESKAFETIPNTLHIVLVIPKNPLYFDVANFLKENLDLESILDDIPPAMGGCMAQVVIQERRATKLTR